jgi:hypothetical protein
MGLLTVSKKLERDHPEIILMILGWLEKECKAQIFNISIGVNTQYYIEGEGIPKGKERFDLILKRVVPEVFTISVRRISCSS